MGSQFFICFSLRLPYLAPSSMSPWVAHSSQALAIRSLLASPFKKIQNRSSLAQIAHIWFTENTSLPHTRQKWDTIQTKYVSLSGWIRYLLLMPLNHREHISSLWMIPWKPPTTRLEVKQAAHQPLPLWGEQRPTTSNSTPKRIIFPSRPSFTFLTGCNIV